ncbi:MAG TPA: cupin domain-containing protein [Acetobacteraceae bacterium]|nr:cupin domain-containing protein [Acetobacteraceae bacterium]
MDRLEFEAELRREGYRVVNSSLKPNMLEANHCHDFDAKLLVLGGEITITRDNKAETFRAGECCMVPAGCMHTEQVGPEGVAYVSGRRRNGGPLTREAFESDLRREGFEVVHGGQKPGYSADPHAHDFDARIMVLGGEITVVRDGKPETFRAGDHCEVPAGCMHGEQVGPEGVAFIAGKAYRRAAAG